MNEYLTINGIDFISDDIELSDNYIAGISNINVLMRDNDFSKATISDEIIDRYNHELNIETDIDGKALNAAETDIIIVQGYGYTGNSIRDWMQIYLNEKTMENVINEIQQDTILDENEYCKIESEKINEYIDYGRFEEDLRFSKGFTRKLNSLIDFYQNKDLEELPEDKRQKWILAFRNSIFDTVSECTEWHEDYEGEMQVFNIDADFCDVFHNNLLNNIQSILKN